MRHGIGNGQLAARLLFPPQLDRTVSTIIQIVA